MDIHTLKQHLTTLMPILDANLAAAHKEYMECDISKGAFEHVRSRHEAALIVLARDDMAPQDAFAACAAFAIDLRTGLKEPAFQNPTSAAQVEAWWQCYRDAGFTEVNHFYTTPKLPTPASTAEQIEQYGTTGAGKTEAFSGLQGSAPA